MSRIRSCVLVAGGAVVVLSIIASRAPAAPPLPPVTGVRTVALSGTLAPPAVSGVTFTDFADQFAPPLVDKDGRAAFLATLSSYETPDPNFPDGRIYDTAIYSEGSGNLIQLAKRRNQPPGTGSGVFYNAFAEPDLNDNGAVAFNAGLYGPNVNRFDLDDSGIWSNRSGAVLQIVRAGQLAIGYPSNVDYGIIGNVAINNSNRMVFAAYPEISNSTNTSVGAIYTDLTGSFQLVARTGDPAPGIPDTTYDIVGSNFWFNNAGHIAYVTSLSGAQTGSALWTKRPGQTPRLAIRTGTPSPGLSSLQLASFDCCIEVAGSENMVFGGDLSGDGVNDGNNETLYFSNTDVTTLIAREGQHAFGLPDGVQFGRIGDLANAVRTFRAAKVNSRGDILFRAGLKGAGVNQTNNSGIWFGNVHDGFHLVARQGAATPGLDDTFGLAQNSALNDLGQAAFLTTTGYSPAAGPTLWAVDYDGQLKLVARQDQQIDVDNGPGVDLRTVYTLDIFPELTNHDNGSFTLGPLGHIAFRATFTDGSIGVFVWSAMAVPEPASSALVAVTCILFTVGFRRSRYR